MLLEALSSRIPVIIRDIPIYAQWLKENETVYKGRTNSEFREKIAEVLCGTIPDLTANGYQEVLDNDLKVVGRRLLDIYKKESVAN
ncbi:Processive diacylglycerol alpha-glucosyltransferase [compost metagenome]